MNLEMFRGDGGMDEALAFVMTMVLFMMLGGCDERAAQPNKPPGWGGVQWHHVVPAEVAQ